MASGNFERRESGMKGRIPANPASVTNAGRVGKCLQVVNRVSVILIPCRNPYREGERETERERDRPYSR